MSIRTITKPVLISIGFLFTLSHANGQCVIGGKSVDTDTVFARLQGSWTFANDTTKAFDVYGSRWNYINPGGLVTWNDLHQIEIHQQANETAYETKGCYVLLTNANNSRKYKIVELNKETLRVMSCSAKIESTFARNQ